MAGNSTQMIAAAVKKARSITLMPAKIIVVVILGVFAFTLVTFSGVGSGFNALFMPEPECAKEIRNMYGSQPTTQNTSYEKKYNIPSKDKMNQKSGSKSGGSKSSKPKSSKPKKENSDEGGGNITSSGIVDNSSFNGIVANDCRSHYSDCPGRTFDEIKPAVGNTVVMPYSDGTSAMAASTYGYKKKADGKDDLSEFNGGMDISGHDGDFNSIADGIVVRVQEKYNDAGVSNITIKHNLNGKIYFSRYLHWSKSYVKVGNTVTAGQKIGVTGDVGSTKGKHLHLEVAQDGENNIQDPARFLAKRGALSGDDIDDGGGGKTKPTPDSYKNDKCGFTENSSESIDLDVFINDSTRNKIVKYALSQVGKAYVWGASDPNVGFDCSGLSQWAYSKAGISISRTAAQQYNNGVHITREQLLPGDLAFSASLDHVAIYIGNGKLVEALNPALGIKVTTMGPSEALFTRIGSLKDHSDNDNVIQDVDEAQAFAKRLISSSAYGDSTTEQWECLKTLWDHESGWLWNAENPKSGAYGIPQALPGNKMAKTGEDWKIDGRIQIKWGMNYIDERYGTPCGAWNHFKKNNWY